MTGKEVQVEARTLSGVLDEHRGVNLTAGWEGSPDSKDPRNIRRVCSCGALIGQLPHPRTGRFALGGNPFDKPHREHIAEVLADFVNQARTAALADAFDAVHAIRFDRDPDLSGPNTFYAGVTEASGRIEALMRFEGGSIPPGLSGSLKQRAAHNIGPRSRSPRGGR